MGVIPTAVVLVTMAMRSATGAYAGDVTQVIAAFCAWDAVDGVRKTRTPAG